MTDQGCEVAKLSHGNPAGVLDPKIELGLHLSLRPSVGHFNGEEEASLYVRRSSAQLHSSCGRKTMDPYSNHGVFCQQSSQQSTQKPVMGIVDLRNAAPGAQGKLNKPAKAKFATS